MQITFTDKPDAIEVQHDNVSDTFLFNILLALAHKLVKNNHSTCTCVTCNAVHALASYAEREEHAIH